MDWRKKEQVDTVIETYQFPEFEEVQKVYSHGYHMLDNQGRPIYIERVGFMDIPKLFETTTEERIVRHYIQEYELLMKVKFPVCSLLAGKHIG